MTVSTEATKLVQSTQKDPEIAVIPDASVVAVPVESTSPQTTTVSSSKSGVLKRRSFSVLLCGDVQQRSTSIAKSNVSITLCGDHTYDLRSVHIPDGTNIRMVIVKLCGDIRLIVPENVSVSTCAIMLCGDRRIDTAAGSDSVTSPHVKLTIVKLCGNVIVTNTDERKRGSHCMCT